MRPLLLALALVTPGALAAEPEICPGGQITVTDGGDYTARICTVAEAAIADLATCNLPLTKPVDIALARDLGAVCVGLYHCGQGQIEVTHPEDLAETKADDGLFSPLETMTFFDSIIYHELVHAAFDDVPCPFESCVATSEYLAYSLQIRSLSDADRSAIGIEAVPSDPVSRDSINAIFVFWAPDKFAIRAWTHLMQRPDACTYVGQIADGAIRFDHEPPFVMSPPD